MAPPKKSHALAGLVYRVANPNVVQVTLAKTVNRKAPPADFARNLTEGVELRLPVARDAKHTNPPLVRLADECDRSG